MSARLWRRIRDWLDTAYPEAVLIPEGIEPRGSSGPLAFDADFFLVIYGATCVAVRQPVRRQAAVPGTDASPSSTHPEMAPLQCSSTAGMPSASEFSGRHVVMSTADHDFSRLCCGPRTAEQLGAAFVFLLTWGTIPCIWYGDEIGMRYVPDLPERRGLDLQRRLQPGRVPDADAVGRQPQRRLLERRPQIALPADRPGPRPPHRRRTRTRPRLDTPTRSARMVAWVSISTTLHAVATPDRSAPISRTPPCPRSSQRSLGSSRPRPGSHSDCSTGTERSRSSRSSIRPINNRSSTASTNRS
jgi:hypothetical protein